MDFEEADRLCTRIADFLVSCGGAYTKVNGEIEKNILHALATGQYVLKEEGGNIAYFAAYWKIRPADLERVLSFDKPEDLTSGTFCYVTEAANRAGRRGMAEMVKELRRTVGNTQGVFWHRPAKQDKAYLFPRQKGGAQ